MCRRRSSLSLWTSWRCSPLFLILDKKRISAPRLKRRLPSFSRPPFLLSHSLPFPLLHSPGRGRGRRSSASLCALDFQQSATSGACASASRAAAHRRRTQIARAAAWLCSLSLSIGKLVSWVCDRFVRSPFLLPTDSPSDGPKSFQVGHRYQQDGQR